MTQGEANAWAWNEGVARLRRAIARRANYVLETTLGGDTIVGLLMEAAAAGIGVNVWFVGLDSVELHVARVQQRVARGGHDIPRVDIERRYRSRSPEPDPTAAPAAPTGRLRQQRAGESPTGRRARRRACCCAGQAA